MTEQNKKIAGTIWRGQKKLEENLKQQRNPDENIQEKQENCKTF